MQAPIKRGRAALLSPCPLLTFHYLFLTYLGYPYPNTVSALAHILHLLDQVHAGATTSTIE